MKAATSFDEINSSVIVRDYICLKTIVRLVKKDGRNLKLLFGKSLFQETKTRFGTVHDVVVRFIEIVLCLQDAFDSNNFEAIENAQTEVQKCLPLSSATKLYLFQL